MHQRVIKGCRGDPRSRHAEPSLTNHPVGPDPGIVCSSSRGKWLGSLAPWVPGLPTPLAASVKSGNLPHQDPSSLRIAIWSPGADPAPRSAPCFLSTPRGQLQGKIFIHAPQSLQSSPYFALLCTMSLCPKSPTAAIPPDWLDSGTDCPDWPLPTHSTANLRTDVQKYNKERMPRLFHPSVASWPVVRAHAAHPT